MRNHAAAILTLVTLLIFASTPIASAGDEDDLVLVRIVGESGAMTDDTVSCGGTAPLAITCATSTTITCCDLGFRIHPGLVFTGRIFFTVESETATSTHRCDLVAWGSGLVPASCTSSQTGLFSFPQEVTVTGRTSQTSVGQWRVQLIN